MNKQDPTSPVSNPDEAQVRVEHEGSIALNLSLQSGKHNRQDLSRLLGRISIEHEIMIVEQIERLRAEGNIAGVNVYIGLTAVVEKQ